MTTAFDIASVFQGEREVEGIGSNPLILAMLRSDQAWPEDDDVPWCSAFVNFVCKLLRLPRSYSLRARSWLQVGVPIPLTDAVPGYDVVILNRGGPPDPDVIEAPGHVGFFAALEGPRVWLLGGNQSDSVKVSSYPVKDVLGVRRLADPFQ